MHRDYMTTGPMYGFGFSRMEMLKYNFTDHELIDNFSPVVAAQLAHRRDELICGRQVWRTMKRFFACVALAMVLLTGWLITDYDDKSVGASSQTAALRDKK
ncbi:MAG TPA: hypothetical protein VFQ91_10045 [Bryobacteraceae bacterium]|nr:hypothetical protein [Bryobacteraceae bacterium]